MEPRIVVWKLVYFKKEIDVALTLVTRNSNVSKIAFTYKRVNFVDADAVITRWTRTFIYIYSKKGRENRFLNLYYHVKKNPHGISTGTINHTSQNLIQP